jgi:hypothetical protein
LLFLRFEKRFCVYGADLRGRSEFIPSILTDFRNEMPPPSRVAMPLAHAKRGRAGIKVNPLADVFGAALANPPPEKRIVALPTVEPFSSANS